MGNNIAPIIDLQSCSYLDKVAYFIGTSLFLKKLCQFKMRSSAPKRLFSKISWHNADNKLMCKTSQLQCLTSIHAHKLTKSSGIWEIQLLRKKIVI